MATRLDGLISLLLRVTDQKRPTMSGKTLETQTEQEHQDEVEESELREEKVNEAIEKIVSSIEQLTVDPAHGDPSVSEFVTTLPMAPPEPE